MATTHGEPNPALIERLLQEPGDFEFFRAVQVLEAHLNGRQGRGAPKHVGFDQASSEVGLRFDAVPSFAFPARTINAVEATGPEGSATSAFAMSVGFLGLVGPSGTLPTHYTEFLLSRLRGKDAALRDYLATFQDRTTAFFYRAWKKYRMPVSYGGADRARGETDPILTAILGLVGLLPRPRGKALSASDLAQAHHAGLFSDRRRSANGLRAMLGGILGCDVRVEQYVGQWVELNVEARSRLGSGPGPGSPACIGEQAVLGTRVFCVDALVRVVAGPLDRERFRSLWPGGEPVRFVWDAIRAYLGPLIDCELVWELAPEAPVPVCLGDDQRLGRDAWLGWDASGSPDTRVNSPPWHNPTYDRVAPEPVHS